MEFIGSKPYYILCGIALIILFIVLLTFYFNPKLAAKRAKQPKQTPSDNIPKYAAGGEMDRINRASYITPRSKNSSFSFAGLGIIILILVIGSPIIQGFSSRQNQSENSPSIKNFASSPLINLEGKKLTMEFKSNDYSPDFTKIYTTILFKNETDINFIDIRPTIFLKSDESTILQSKELEEISKLKPGETKEIVAAIELSPENKGKTIIVSGEVKYQGAQP